MVLYFEDASAAGKQPLRHEVPVGVHTGCDVSRGSADRCLTVGVDCRPPPNGKLFFLDKDGDRIHDHGDEPAFCRAPGRK